MEKSRRSTAVVVAATACLVGCSSVDGTRSRARGDLFDVTQVPSRQSAIGRALGASADVCQSPNAADLQALREKFDKTIAGCNAILSGYEKQSNQAKWTLAGIAIVGGVAGSIVVPSLVAKASVSKSAIAGWSGLSGASNFAQHVFVNDGLAPADSIKVREGIRAQLSIAIDKFTSTSSDYCAREDALAKMAAACINYELFLPSQPINETTTPKPTPATSPNPKDGNSAPQATTSQGAPLAPEPAASAGQK